MDTPSCPPGTAAFCCRRLLRPDLARLCALETAFFAPNAAPGCALLQKHFLAGQCFGVFCSGELIAALTVLPLSVHLSPANELRSTKLPAFTDQNAMLLCDIAVAQTAPARSVLDALLTFVSSTFERALGEPARFCAVMPVKTAVGIGAMFDAGLWLYAARPLRNLTPCWLFGTPYEMRPATETLTLTFAAPFAISRALDEGWHGTEVHHISELLLRR